MTSEPVAFPALRTGHLQALLVGMMAGSWALDAWADAPSAGIVLTVLVGGFVLLVPHTHRDTAEREVVVTVGSVLTGRRFALGAEAKRRLSDGPFGRTTRLKYRLIAHVVGLWLLVAFLGLWV